VKARRIVAAVVAGALGVAGLLVAPALGAVGGKPVRMARAAAPARLAGSFTPAAADPRLAALFARGGLSGGDFRFTPAETRRDGRAVTVAVRARSNRPGSPDRLTPMGSGPGLTPTAYTLGATVGWKGIAIAGDLAHLDAGPLPGSRDAADVSVSYGARRFTGRVRATADRPVGEVATLVDQPQSYSLDVAGSYRLTRNLDVTAGVRYRSDRERLVRTDDERRDSQAAYVGTIFRF
jgi:hypothetical protein